ncbi:hypothetical protein [Catellatospora coxensis]|uniref:Uncharacterized protein n=1 Tax=Catellatospora coxensis TaxID=310354 RepID=A0A8J3KRL6_9ACTN|nr:hypothetical protein [Catellatospora coxensis]GIG04948.1 hypothetical protein Cco03nite_16480 [Catellatospora coxensis]
MIDSARREGPHARHVFRIAMAVIALAAAGAAAAVMAVPGRGGPSNTGTLYTAHHKILVGLLVVCGLLLAAARRERLAGAAAVAGAITGAQLCAIGVWAARHWRPMIGMVGYPEANLGQVQALALVMAASAAVATLACLAVVRRSGVWRPAVLDGPWRRGLLLAATVAVAVLPALGIVERDFLTMKIATHALLYSLPWGLAVAACVRLHRSAAVAAALAVAGSALAHTGRTAAFAAKYAEISYQLPALIAFPAVAAVAAGVLVIAVRDGDEEVTADPPETGVEIAAALPEHGRRQPRPSLSGRGSAQRRQRSGGYWPRSPER